MDQLDLSDFFTTKAGSVDFSARLGTIQKKIYETGFDLDSCLLTEFGIQKKDRFLALIRNAGIDIKSNSAFLEFLTRIQEKIPTLPVASFTLAFEPDENTLRSLSQWFTLNVNRQVVFEITVDPKLIAGAALTYNGRYEDYSQKTKFAQIVSQSLSANQ